MSETTHVKSASVQMDASSKSRASGGLWNNPRATQYSKETQDMLRLMMQESRLTTLQRKQISQCVKNGAALPLTPDPTSSSSLPQPKSCKSVQVRLSGKPQRRSAESCRFGNSYIRERFHPGPTRDLEKEKRRLQNILSTGHDKPPSSTNTAYHSPEVSEDRDRYQEVLDEIEERRQFLTDMTYLGQEKKYINIINTEISQKIRELEMLDKACCSQKDALASERKESREEQMTQHMERNNNQDADL